MLNLRIVRIILLLNIIASSFAQTKPLDSYNTSEKIIDSIQLESSFFPHSVSTEVIEELPTISNRLLDENTSQIVEDETFLITENNDNNYIINERSDQERSEFSAGNWIKSDVSLFVYSLMFSTFKFML